METPQEQPRLPWKWWLIDEDHWVAYPDKVLEVGTIPDDHLGNILRYLAKWAHDYVAHFSTVWLAHSGYFSAAINDLSDHGQDAVEYEMNQLMDQTDREWIVRIIPVLPKLEAEARLRGIPVPAIPSYSEPLRVGSGQEAHTP